MCGFLSLTGRSTGMNGFRSNDLSGKGHPLLRRESPVESLINGRSFGSLLFHTPTQAVAARWSDSTTRLNQPDGLGSPCPIHALSETDFSSVDGPRDLLYVIQVGKGIAAF